MQQTILADKSGRQYQGWIGDKKARDQKVKQLKDQGYKEIETGSYICQGGATVYFLTWK